MNLILKCFLLCLPTLPLLLCLSIARPDHTHRSANTPSLDEKNLTDCPLLWRQFGKKCYRVYNESQSFLDAMLTCKYLFNNSHVLQINDEQEQQYINQLMFQGQLKSVWISVVGFVETGDFMMISESGHPSPLAYTNWEKPNEPKFISDRENCVMIFASYSPNWMNVRCSPFLLSPRVVCERPVFSEETHVDAQRIKVTNEKKLCANDKGISNLPPSRLAHQLSQHLQTEPSDTSGNHHLGWTCVIWTCVAVALLMGAILLIAKRLSAMDYALPFRPMRDEPLGL